jgi:VanZ family protein
MTLPPRSARPRLRPWLVWLGFAALWTTALLVPVPTQALGVSAAFHFPIAKTVHVLAYATFTVLAGRVGVPARLRWLPLFVVMAHAPASELLQGLTATRHPSLADVAIDHAGVALGLLVSWGRWSAPDPPAGEGAAAGE